MTRAPLRQDGHITSDERTTTVKVLVATQHTQGSQPDDYCFTLEGELVTPLAVACSNPSCGCRRGFPGLASSRATTTALVVDLPHIDEPALVTAITDSLERGGWFRGLSARACRHMVDDHVQAVHTVCARYPVGTIVVRSDEHVYLRTARAA
jgi:hypothetical protein